MSGCLYCYRCGIAYDTLEGIQRHQYYLHGGKIWPKTGYIEQRRQEIAIFDAWRRTFKGGRDNES